LSGLVLVLLLFVYWRLSAKPSFDSTLDLSPDCSSLALQLHFVAQLQLKQAVGSLDCLG
jgi:hypothetical protein